MTPITPNQIEFTVDYHDGKGAQAIDTDTALQRLANRYKDVGMLLEDWSIGESRPGNFSTYTRTK